MGQLDMEQLCRSATAKLVLFREGVLKVNRKVFCEIAGASYANVSHFEFGINVRSLKYVAYYAIAAGKLGKYGEFESMMAGLFKEAGSGQD